MIALPPLVAVSKPFPLHFLNCASKKISAILIHFSLEPFLLMYSSHIAAYLGIISLFVTFHENLGFIKTRVATTSLGKSFNKSLILLALMLLIILLKEVVVGSRGF